MTETIDLLLFSPRTVCFVQFREFSDRHLVGDLHLCLHSREDAKFVGFTQTRVRIYFVSAFSIVLIRLTFLVSSCYQVSRFALEICKNRFISHRSDIRIFSRYRYDFEKLNFDFLFLIQANA